MKKLLLFLLVPLFGCSTGEGPKQYIFGDTYTVVTASTNPVEVLIEMYNQRAESSTGRDRTTRPSASVSLPAPIP